MCESTLSLARQHKRNRTTPRTYPAVDLELLVQDGLLHGRGLRARRRGREATHRLPEHPGAGSNERLHGDDGGGGGEGEVVNGDREGEEERGRRRNGRCTRLRRRVASGRACYPGPFGRVSPIQSRAPNFLRLPPPSRSRTQALSSPHAVISQPPLLPVRCQCEFEFKGGLQALIVGGTQRHSEPSRRIRREYYIHTEYVLYQCSSQKKHTNCCRRNPHGETDAIIKAQNNSRTIQVQ